MGKIKCTKCDEVLESKHRHDFVSCGCGTFVDGGNAYLRIGGDLDQILIWVEDEWKRNHYE